MSTLLEAISNIPNPEPPKIYAGPDPEVCVLCRWDWPAGCVPAGPDAGCAGPGAGGHLSLDRLLQAGQRRGLRLQVVPVPTKSGIKICSPKCVKI